MKKFLIAGALCASMNLQAADFQLADELLAAREGSIENTLAARAAYQELIDQGLSGVELERAVIGMARTYVYEGEVLTGIEADADVEARRKIFKTCWNDTMPLIAPDKLGFESPAYYYFSATCMAYYGQVSGTLENLANAPRLTRTIENGLDVEGGLTFEGGGLNRVKAAVKSNEKAKPLPGGFYDPELALELINGSIDSPAYPGSYEGFLFCENFRRKIDVLKVLDRDAEANELATQTLEEFDFLLELEEIPASLIPETKHCLNVIEAGLADAQ